MGQAGADGGADLEPGPSHGCSDRPSLALALGLCAVGATAAIASWQISPGGFTDPNDPGPRFLPMAAGLFLAGGGLIELVRWRMARRSRPDGGGGIVGPAKDRRSFVIAAASIVGFVAALPLLGFALGSVIFSILMVRLLGGKWWSAVLTASVATGLAVLLFVGLFNVQLPNGVLGMPF